MAIYLIGDVQGCDTALQRLFDELDFSASRDQAYFLGDLVNRGPDSLAVLRRVQRLQGSAHTVLGNHDLHLMALAAGTHKPRADDTLNAVLQAPEREALVDWLRAQPLALQAHGFLMVHAGVLPNWTVAQTLNLAAEVQQQLRGHNWRQFFPTLYGNQPDQWSDTLVGAERWRVVVNALTRLRFCTPEGRMDLLTKEGLAAAQPGYWPWFDVPGRRSAQQAIAFGHWSTLGWLMRPDIVSLDTGCVWGGCLSALRLNTTNGQHERIQVTCAQAAKPGATA